MRVIVLKKKRSNKRVTSSLREKPSKKFLDKKDLFLNKIDHDSPSKEGKHSIVAAPTMKAKWLKAIRRLKPSYRLAGRTDRNYISNVWGPKRYPLEDGSHHLQEYTYKKITPCDVCSQILRGHTRQGLRCRKCKLNVHGDCAMQLPRCHSKQKLLRRQISTSELENRIETDNDSAEVVDMSLMYNHSEYPESTSRLTDDINNIDSICTGRRVRYRKVPMPILGVQLQQQELQRSGLGGGGIPSLMGASRTLPIPTADIWNTSVSHSPFKQNLNLQMKSLSLDSPERMDLNGKMKRKTYSEKMIMTGTSASSANFSHINLGEIVNNSTPPSSNSHWRCLSNNSNQAFKLLCANRHMKDRNELPDFKEKSQSSASSSLCPSPENIQHLLPKNLYVVLYNFEARHADELDLKAGCKVIVIDTSNKQWWKGKAFGRVGYFPSKYCIQLNDNEKPLQVSQNLQVFENKRGDEMTLLRDQIVIQISKEVKGMIMIRTAENFKGYCPAKYLQDV